MADEQIKRAFVDGIQELFTTLFNDGKNDGLDLYLLSEQTQVNVYGESPNKVYQKPKRLVTQARLTPTQTDPDVEQIKDKATFVVPVKSLQEHNLDLTNRGLDKLRKGIIVFHGTQYIIDNILPKAYVEDVFLLYHFVCTEDRSRQNIVINTQ